ncbi:MAG: hypothetical protein Q8N23_18305 [Archangium sp.]|nr:hypothetical protein [Archangium sp.]MDP3572735.1 hypothetical protein [Archangium sp.]
MSSEPRSTRRPWIRSGLMGLVPLLLPFVWVLELDACGHAVPLEKELTGLMVFGRFDVEGWLLVAAVMLAALITPYLAAKVSQLGSRVWLHVVGLVAAGLAGYVAFFGMFFTLFADRVVRGVGWVVLAAFALSFVDAVVRVVWSTQEWLRARALTSS